MILRITTDGGVFFPLRDRAILPGFANLIKNVHRYQNDIKA